MRCVGITKKIDRCKNKAGFLFCQTHRFQWIGLISLVAMIAGLFQDLIKPVYLSIFENPIEYNVAIVPQNPTDSKTFPGYLDFPYIIQNVGNIRANNINVKILDLVPTKASMSPQMELIQERDSLIDGAVTEIQYNVEKLDPGEKIIFWLSIKKKSYFSRLQLQPLAIGQKFSTKGIDLPIFSYFKFDEGFGYVRKQDTLEIVFEKPTLPNLSINSNLRNKNRANIDYTVERLGQISVDTDRIFIDLRNIKVILDKSKRELDWEFINQQIHLTNILFYEELMEDSIVNSTVSDNFKNFHSSSIKHLQMLQKTWKNDTLNKNLIYNMIKYYNNEVVLARKFLIVEKTWLKGNITDSLQQSAYKHYILKKILNDSLPLVEIGKIDYN